jgi:hypothetical protein
VLVIYIQDPRKSSPAPIAISDESSFFKALLDEDLSPVKCYDKGGLRVQCPEKLLPDRAGDAVVVGGIVAEAYSPRLELPYMDERILKLHPKYTPNSLDSLMEVVKGNLGLSRTFAEGTILTVVPGQLVSRKAFAVAYAGVLSQESLDIKFEALLDTQLNSYSRKYTRWSLLERYEDWLSVPWQYVLAPGKNMRRLLEIVLERPVARLPKKFLLDKYKSPQDFLKELQAWLRGVKLPFDKRREVRRLVVFIDENLFKVNGGYRAVVIAKNTSRKIVARWYFDRKLELQGFDGFPPEAVRDTDMEVAVGNVPREVQAMIPVQLASFIIRQAILSPIKIEDFVALKVHRWVEIAELL